MKIKCSPNQIARRLAWFLLLGTALTSGAATFLQGSYTNSFDTSTSVASWITWYGLGFNNNPMTWDGTMDAGNNPSSGSLQVVLPFTSTRDTGVWFGTFGNMGAYDKSVLLDGTLYTNISVDVHVDPSTPLSTNGDFGTLLIGMVDQNTDAGGYTYFSGQTIPASATNGWVHLVQPIDKSTPNLNICAGVDFKMGNRGIYPTTTFRMWLDNVEVHKAPPPPPPTLLPPVLAKAGLNLFSNGTDPAQRSSIEVVAGVSSGWVGNATPTNPVSYSVTISDYPPAPHNLDYQTHIFITTDNPPVYRTTPDDAATNAIIVDIRGTTTGGRGHFRYKINQPNSSANLTNQDNGTAGTLATIDSPSVLGTWTVTFTNNTAVSLTTPNGTSTNFSLSTTAAAQFDESNTALNPTPLSVYVGARPNNAANVGQRVVLDSFQMVGNPAALSDTFSTDSTLDTTRWRVVTENQGTVILVPPEPQVFASWTVPDSGFGLRTTSQLLGANTTWTLLTGAHATVGPYTSLVLPTGKITLVPLADIDSTNLFFFQLINGQ
jgi:hypothetical protein